MRNVEYRIPRIRTIGRVSSSKSEFPESGTRKYIAFNLKDDSLDGCTHTCMPVVIVGSVKLKTCYIEEAR